VDLFERRAGMAWTRTPRPSARSHRRSSPPH